jgi:hypothetical protein
VVHYKEGIYILKKPWDGSPKKAKDILVVKIWESMEFRRN